MKAIVLQESYIYLVFKLFRAIARAQIILFDCSLRAETPFRVERLYEAYNWLQICLQTKWNCLNLASFFLIGLFSLICSIAVVRYMQLRKPIWRHHHTQFSRQPDKLQKFPPELVGFQKNGGGGRLQTLPPAPMYAYGLTNLLFDGLSPGIVFVCLSVEYSRYILPELSVFIWPHFKSRCSFAPLKPKCKQLLNNCVFKSACGEWVPRTLYSKNNI